LDGFRIAILRNDNEPDAEGSSFEMKLVVVTGVRGFDPTCIEALPRRELVSSVFVQADDLRFRYRPPGGNRS
jgi:hypothetical protein